MKNSEISNFYLMFHRHISKSILLALLLIGFIACEFKGAKYFAPPTAVDLPDHEPEIPSYDELVGLWTFLYNFASNTCNDQSEQFNANGEITHYNDLEFGIMLTFSDAPDHPIIGMFNVNTAEFAGETLEGADVSGGQGNFFAYEEYDGKFVRGLVEKSQKQPDHGIFFTGISTVEVFDSEDNPVCTIEYEVEGERTGPLP